MILLFHPTLSSHLTLWAPWAGEIADFGGMRGKCLLLVAVVIGLCSFAAYNWVSSLAVGRVFEADTERDQVSTGWTSFHRLQTQLLS